jgi:hypothetical protein
LTLRLFTRTVRGLHVLQHFIEVSLDDAFTFTRLVIPTIGDHLLILSNAIGDSILTNRAGGFAELIARLLPILPHSARSLIQIAFESRNLVRKRLFAFGDLLLLLVAGAALLPASRKLIHAAADFFLPLQCLFGALSQLLNVLLTSRALSRFESSLCLLHSIERPKLIGGRLLLSGRL